MFQYMDIEEVIREIVESYLPDEQYFITDVRAKEGGAKTKITINLDGDEGIGIGVCASINKQLGRRLEEMELFNHPYTVEVSSPGLDQPLRLTRQYHRNIGKNVRIILAQEQFEGKLESVTNDHVIINQKADKGGSLERKVPFSEIVNTHVLVSF